MRILLDTCVSGVAADRLRAAGHDVVHATEWPTDPGDEEIIARAHADQRVLVTLDKDFGELAVVQGRPHAGIIRLVGYRGAAQGPRLARVLIEQEADLTAGAIVTVDPGRVRVRPGEQGD